MRIRTILLALVAVLAVSAAAAATASAAAMPLIVNEKGETPTKTGFKGTSKESTFETKGRSTALKCKEDTISGKLTGPSTDTAEIKFKKCKASILACKTSGAAAEEIVLKVTSELVWVNEAETEVGEDLVPTTSPVTIECTGLEKETLKVEGSTICAISGYHSLSITGTITCVQSGGVQKYTKYFLAKEAKEDFTKTEGSGFETFGFTQSGLEGTDSLEYEEKVEIM